MFTIFLFKSKKRLYSKGYVRSSASGFQNITICFKHIGSAFAVSFKGSLRPQKSVIETSAGFNPVLGSALKHYPTVARPGVQTVFWKVGSARNPACSPPYSFEIEERALFKRFRLGYQMSDLLPQASIISKSASSIQAQPLRCPSRVASGHKSPLFTCSLRPQRKVQSSDFSGFNPG